MSGALAFLAGAIVGGLFVLGAGWFLVLSGSRRADRGVGWIFAGSGLLLLVGVGGGQPAVVGAGAGALAGSVGLVLGRAERNDDLTEELCRSPRGLASPSRISPRTSSGTSSPGFFLRVTDTRSGEFCPEGGAAMP